MDALQYLKTKGRMTNSCQIDCCNCLMAYKNNGRSVQCTVLEREYSDEAIGIVEEWGKKHPIITNAEKYEQMMKNFLGDDFEIEICPNKSHDVPGCACEKMNSCNECVKFWNSEYGKKEKIELVIKEEDER